MAYGVGAGKTAAIIIAGHETRRTGRVEGTTLHAVPGNMVEQFTRDYLRLQPAARVITPRDTDRDSIREFAARVATGDFDAALCSNNALNTIPLHPPPTPNNSNAGSTTSPAANEVIRLCLRHGTRTFRVSQHSDRELPPPVQPWVSENDHLHVPVRTGRACEMIVELTRPALDLMR